MPTSDAARRIRTASSWAMDRESCFERRRKRSWSEAGTATFLNSSFSGFGLRGSGVWVFFVIILYNLLGFLEQGICFFTGFLFPQLLLQFLDAPLVAAPCCPVFFPSLQSAISTIFPCKVLLQGFPHPGDAFLRARCEVPPAGGCQIAGVFRQQGFRLLVRGLAAFLFGDASNHWSNTCYGPDATRLGPTGL